MLPKIFIDKIKLILKDEFDAFMNTYSQEPYSGIRINLNKIDTNSFLNKYSTHLNIENNKVPWCDSGLYYKKELNVSKSPLYNAGLFYIQEPSAMSPVEFLQIKEGMKVLDICAAPGGKTTQIASKLKNTGLIVSNDISLKRTKAILKNVEMHGIKNCLITNASPDELLLNFPSYFDRILVDAPCSGEGMFRKDKDIIKSYEKVLSNITEIQKDILFKSSKMLKSGGIIVYSTCTFSREENEDIIDDFIRQNDDFYVVDKDVEQYNFSKDNVQKTFKLFPHKINGEGHFVAILKKKEKISDDTSYNLKKYTSKISKNENKIKVFNDFVQDFMNSDFSTDITVNNNSLYLEVFKSALKSVRVIRNGLYLGDIKNNKFIPSPAFIMSEQKSNFKKTISLKLDDANLIKYLKCETLNLDFEDGEYIICVDEYPLGLIKIKNCVGKNFYNPNWRIQ